MHMLLRNCIRYIWLSVVISPNWNCRRSLASLRLVCRVIQCHQSLALRVGFMTKLLACQFTPKASSLPRSGLVAPTLHYRCVEPWCPSPALVEAAQDDCSVSNTTAPNKYNSKASSAIERPQLMCDYPLNLSILIRGGKETKWDSQSSGERNGNSPARRVVGFTAHRPVPCKGGSIISRT